MRLLGCLRVLLLAAAALVVAKDDPDVSTFQLTSRPYKLSFFDDSETALVLDENASILYRTTNAGKDWTKPDGVSQGDALDIILNPRDNKVAVVIGEKKTHWITLDQGATWRSFSTPEHPSLRTPITFHWSDSKRILYHTFDEQIVAHGIGKTYYTTDGFDKVFELLHPRRHSCTWAKATDLFTTGDEKKDLDRTLCVVEGKYSMMMKDYKLLVSDDYFAHAHEPELSQGRTVTGIINVAPVKGFILVAAKVPGSQELALFVSKDTNTWHHAEFGNHQLKEDSYTLLESTNYSIQVQVVPDHNMGMGSLFSSNSNGTYFRRVMDHVNRNRRGMMDFEQIAAIQGTYLVNQVDNWQEVEKREGAAFQIKTVRTIDDGRTFEDLLVGKDRLHVHSVTELHNSGRVFSSPAPGIVMANGNTGNALESWDRGSLFVSDDGGRNWIKSDTDGPQKYEFGDQGSLLVAIRDNDDFVDDGKYSLNHGKSWKKFDFDKKIQPFELTTIADATALKFVLTGRDNDDNWWLIHLNFEGLHKRACKDSDFEDWYARKDDKGNAQCLMGHKQHFRRRKADAECFIGHEFDEALPKSEQCDCTEEDFECDFNFRRSSDGKCEPAGRILDVDHKCKDREGIFMGSSGWRKIPGNDCKRSSGKQKDDLIQRQCADVFAPPASGEITKTYSSFRGDKFASMYYLEKSSEADGTDETIVLLTTEMEALITHDHGKSWNPALSDNAKVRAIYPHQYNNDYVYFITPSKTVYYSKNRGLDVHRFEAPDIPNLRGLPVLSFHQKNPDWLLWTGNQDCSSTDHGNCHTTAHLSTKNGEGSWNLLMSWIKRCQFMYREGRKNSEDLIFCEHWEAENLQGPLQLLSSKDRFEHHEAIFKNTVAFATMAEFIIVAAKQDDGKYLSAHASVDGQTFADAAFPAGFKVEHQSAYTVLDSNTNAVFLHVTENSQRGQEYGTILKSNSNGTSYVLSTRHVNRNEAGYVDWEKMLGIEGVAVVNIVSNTDDVQSGDQKHLKTMITHDDGAFWSYLPCPEKDLDGNSYNCGSDTSKKSLHLHGYTERRDSRETYSSPSAVGIMIGVGNVGEKLGLYNEADTFMTKDAGVTWKPIMKGTYMWEYGDQGSIILLVQRHIPTRDAWYSVDEGESWKKFEFDGDGMTQVDRITTVPSDNSRQFLLWGKKDGKLTTVNLDFTGLTDRACKLDKENLDSPSSDYELWSPQHPHKETDKECLFGHVSRYYRKKPNAKCYNGPLIDRLHDIARNCSCTRQDFECDFNYERRLADGTCVLIEGLQTRPAEQICTEDKSRTVYYDPTGYRKIPLSTCQGGRELEYVGEPKACPGHEEEYKESHSLSWIGLFFSVIVPVGAAAAAGYFVWTRYGSQFGQIRLGDSTMGSDARSAFSSDRPWIAWPVAAASGLVAVASALPLLAGSLWRSATSRFGSGSGARTYTSRSSFARGRGDYSNVVDDDEGELLGDDSDEEV